MGRFAARNGPYRSAIWAVLHRGVAVVAISYDSGGHALWRRCRYFVARLPFHMEHCSVSNVGSGYPSGGAVPTFWHISSCAVT